MIRILLLACLFKDLLSALLLLIMLIYVTRDGTQHNSFSFTQ